MTIAIKFENIITEIGPGAIFHAYCSTVSSNLEPNGWGSKYPKLLNVFYQGELPASDAADALSEIREIAAELKSLLVENITWDIENTNSKPPKEYDDTCDKSSIYNYFKTINGLNLSWALEDIFEAQIESGSNSKIISYGNIHETIGL